MTKFHDFASLEQENWARASLATEYVGRFAQAANQSIPMVLESVAPIVEQRALDICCGQGSLAVALHSAGARVIGIDFSDAMLEFARRSASGIEFRLADAQNLRFPDNTFDIAVCGFGICHLPDQPKALSEASRILRKGGRFAMTVWCGPDRSESFEILYSAIKNHGDSSVNLPPGPDFHQFANPQTANQLLLQAGFTSTYSKIIDCSWDFEAPDELCTAFEKATARASVLLANQPSENLAAIRAEMRRHVSDQYRVGVRFKVPIAVTLVVAEK